VSRQSACQLPVLVVTADVQNSTRTECLALGATAICAKSSLYPDGQDFLQVVAEIFSRKTP
jgi:CheY-like chemotaxis protein